MRMKQASGQNQLVMVMVTALCLAADRRAMAAESAEAESLATSSSIYAETDRNLTRNMQAAATLMSMATKSYGLMVYEGVGHAFHNDTGAAYNATAAMDAWARTIAYYDKWLRRPR